MKLDGQAVTTPYTFLGVAGIALQQLEIIDGAGDRGGEGAPLVLHIAP